MARLIVNIQNSIVISTTIVDKYLEFLLNTINIEALHSYFNKLSIDIINAIHILHKV